MEAQFYKGKENSVLLALFADGIVVDYGTLTDVVFHCPQGTLSMLLTPTLFAVEVGGVRLKFGASSLEVGVYSMSLTVYSAAHPLGILWDDNVSITIRET